VEPRRLVERAVLRVERHYLVTAAATAQAREVAVRALVEIEGGVEVAGVGGVDAALDGLGVVGVLEAS
jgi:hypothetical protein